MSERTRTVPRDMKNITFVDVINMIQEIPKHFVGTKEGVAFVSLMTGILLEQGGFSKMVFKLKPNTFLDEATSEKLEKAGSENAFCLSLGATGRSQLCEMKPKLNIEFDIWPWKGLAIPDSFGKFDMPVAKLLMLLGTMGLSAEFVKGVGGIVPG